MPSRAAIDVATSKRVGRRIDFFIGEELIMVVEERG
jgi:hypothetical protein